MDDPGFRIDADDEQVGTGDQAEELFQDEVSLTGIGGEMALGHRRMIWGSLLHSLSSLHTLPILS